MRETQRVFMTPSNRYALLACAVVVLRISEGTPDDKQCCYPDVDDSENAASLLEAKGDIYGQAFMFGVFESATADSVAEDSFLFQAGSFPMVALGVVFEALRWACHTRYQAIEEMLWVIF